MASSAYEADVFYTPLSKEIVITKHIKTILIILQVINCRLDNINPL